MTMTLYTYFRSSASYRVRIALNLKGLAYERVTVHLTRGGGEQLEPAFRAMNPNAVVPALKLDDGTVLTQSMAIIEYLDERHPSPPLLPKDPVQKALVRAAAQLIACDIHPINNLRVLQHLKGGLGHGQDDIVAWNKHWMRGGLNAFVQSIDRDSPFSFDAAPTLADLCLVPQLYNAARWGLDLTGLERLVEIRDRCLALAPFKRASPEEQPDAE